MTKKIFIVFYSKAGNTRSIADHIMEIFSKITPEGIQMKLMDARELDFDSLKNASGYIIGTPNFFSAPSGYVKVFFDEMFPSRATLRGRPVFCFVTHGGSGNIEDLKVLCNWLELETVGPTVVVRGKNITPQDTSLIEENLKKMVERT
jgi:multimeric flavodoxin WrbA